MPIALVTEVVALLPTLISAGIDVTNLITQTQGVIDSNKGPTDDDWNRLDQQVNDLRNQFAQAAS